MTTAPDLAARAWVLLPMEAKTRGFRNALAFRRWCRSHAVEIRKDGRKEWVSPAAVAVAKNPPAPDAGGHVGLMATLSPTQRSVLDMVRDFPAENPSRVYFIASGEDAIKIGVALKPRSRIGELQVGNPVALKLLLDVPGDVAIEQTLLRRAFDHLWIRGEWVRRDPQLEAFMRLVRLCRLGPR